MCNDRQTINASTSGPASHVAGSPIVHRVERAIEALRVARADLEAPNRARREMRQAHARWVAAARMAHRIAQVQYRCRFRSSGNFGDYLVENTRLAREAEQQLGQLVEKLERVVGLGVGVDNREWLRKLNASEVPRRYEYLFWGSERVCDVLRSTEHGQALAELHDADENEVPAEEKARLRRDLGLVAGQLVFDLDESWDGGENHERCGHLVDQLTSGSADGSALDTVLIATADMMNEPDAFGMAILSVWAATAFCEHALQGDELTNIARRAKRGLAQTLKTNEAAVQSILQHMTNHDRGAALQELGSVLGGGRPPLPPFLAMGAKVFTILNLVTLAGEAGDLDATMVGAMIDSADHVLASVEFVSLATEALVSVGSRRVAGTLAWRLAANVGEIGLTSLLIAPLVGGTAAGFDFLAGLRDHDDAQIAIGVIGGVGVLVGIGLSIVVFSNPVTALAAAAISTIVLGGAQAAAIAYQAYQPPPPAKKYLGRLLACLGRRQATTFFESSEEGHRQQARHDALNAAAVDGDGFGAEFEELVNQATRSLVAIDNDAVWVLNVPEGERSRIQFKLFSAGLEASQAREIAFWRLD